MKTVHPKKKTDKEIIVVDIPEKFGTSQKKSGAGKHSDKRLRRNKKGRKYSIEE